MSEETMIALEVGRTYALDYTNHSGRRDVGRKVRVTGFSYGTNQYHPTPDLMVLAVDVARDDDVVRTFPAGSIHHVAEA